ncbi:hypothetical protein DSO57_1011170 [Entomophthora muscae]|uniref:Uncharacterized protein n=1 Tax=Entomophthora muscae TaxID=34485 RepID=A0ACC2TI76_9FUNG|nr:hypothetical protein DSO57_1011170 [Entomophthora muscae]
MMDARRFGYQVLNDVSCISFTIPTSDRASPPRKNATQKVIPTEFRQCIEDSSFDDMLKNGVSVQGTRMQTIKLSLTPRNVQLDGRS